MTYSFLHELHIFMHLFLVTPHKLQNPAGKNSCLRGELFLTWQKQCFEFQTAFLSHHNSAVTSMQNIMKNASRCCVVENETWVYDYKDVRWITAEFTQLKQKKYKITPFVWEPLLMVRFPKGDPDPTESQCRRQASLNNFLSKQIYRNAGRVQKRQKFPVPTLYLLIHFNNIYNPQ